MAEAWVCVVAENGCGHGRDDAGKAGARTGAAENDDGEAGAADDVDGPNGFDGVTASIDGVTRVAAEDAALIALGATE